MIHPTLRPLVVASLLLSAASLQAAVVGVEWGSAETVDSDQALVLPTPNDLSGMRVWSQTDSTPLTPSGPNYRGTPFYGIVQNQVGGVAADFGSAIIMNRGDGRDRFYFQGTESTTGTSVLSGLVYVKKEDFLNDLSGPAPLRFDEGSAMSLKVSNIAGGNGGALVRAVRLAVLDGSQWYVSASYVSSTDALNLSDLSTSRWIAYPGEGTLPLAVPSFNDIDYGVLGSSFSDIQAVGIYFLNSRAGNNSARDFSFDLFSASFAEPVPEPSSVALVGVTGGVGLWMLRRRKAQK